MSTSFIAETSEHKKPRIIVLAVVVSLVAAIVAFLLFSSWSLEIDFSSFTPMTLFVSGFASGLFFFGLPLEAALFTAVRTGAPPLASMAAIVAGFVLGNLISYIIGWKLSRLALMFVSAKKLYGLRRKVNKQGSVFVFLANAIPFLPAPILTFGLGIARYNMARLFTFLIAGAVVKFSATAYLSVLLS